MKILTEREKKILINHAKKQELRRIISKKKKKNKRRYLQGKSKEERQKYILENRFKDYSKIKAPSNFSLIENTEESLKFIAKIEKCLKNRSKVFVNLTDVETIAHGAIVVLLSIMTKFKYNHIDFNGNFPKNKNANKALVDSGFFDQLYKRNISNEPNYAFCRNKVLTHAGKVVDSSLADQIISEISNLIWGKQRRCLGVQRVFLELMQNTNNHASFDSKGLHHWWTTVQYDEKLKKAYFSFIDYGVGIINSLRNDEHGKFYNIIPKIRELFNPQNNAEMLSLLLKGEIHKTSTGKYYRGKGLPCLFKACEDNKIANVVVIANDAKVEYTAGTNGSVSGTTIEYVTRPGNSTTASVRPQALVATAANTGHKDIIIKIATDFSRIPGARYPEEGDYSGQEFRQNVLHPALKKAIEMNVKLIVDLDGTAGLGTSFLEESFGGLIRRPYKLQYSQTNTYYNFRRRS